MCKLAKLHDWNLSPRDAIALQNELRGRLHLQTPPQLLCMVNALRRGAIQSDQDNESSLL